MFRSHIKRTSYLVAFLPMKLFEDNYDLPKDYEQLKPGSIGIDRLKAIFYKQDNGELSPELRNIVGSFSSGFLIGGLLGGIIRMAKVPEKFASENMATQFHSHFQASRAMQNKTALEFLKGSLAVGWRVSLFYGFFQTCATLFYVYDGQTSVTHYMMAGGLTGMIFKIHSGVKATISGAVIGSALGSVAGGLIKAILYLSGRTMKDIYDTRDLEYREQMRLRASQGTDLILPHVKETYDENQKGKL